MTAAAKRKEISFDVSKRDFTLIHEITGRALTMAALRGSGANRMDLEMDITACHANGCPLKLEALLLADDFNFAHDVFGISRHIDRDTGELTNGFSPRYSQPEAA